MDDNSYIDQRKESTFLPHNVHFNVGENASLCPSDGKIYPYAAVLRLRVLQIVCGISGVVMGTVAFIEERGEFNLGIAIPAGLLTVTAAAGSIHTSRGFGGYVQPTCDPPLAALRFLGPSITSAISLAVLWSSACVLHLVLIWNAICSFYISDQLTVLSVVLMAMTIVTLIACILLLRIDCIYDPD